MKKTLFLCSIIAIWTLWGYSQTTMVFEDWQRQSGSQNSTQSLTIQTDSYGAVYVAGATSSIQGDLDLSIRKYDRRGNLVWSDQYDGVANGDDAAFALVVDAHCNAYVTGKSWTSPTDSFDVITIHYDSSGARQWVASFGSNAHHDDWGTCISLESNALYVGGNSRQNGTGFDFLALRYDLNGGLMWSTTYDGSGLDDLCEGISSSATFVTLGGTSATNGVNNDIVLAQLQAANGSFTTQVTSTGTVAGQDQFGDLATDASGNLYLTGSIVNTGTGRDAITKKFDPSLGILWSRAYHSSGNQADVGNAIAFDGLGSTYVAGYMDSTGQSTDFTTLKYDPNGNLQWAKIWNDSADGADSANAIAVDNAGNVIVAGTAWNGYSTDFHTVKYSSNGNLVWETDFNDKYNYGENVSDCAMDPSGNVFVAGQAGIPGNQKSNIVIRYFETQIILPNDPEPLSTSLRFIENRDQLINASGQFASDVRFYSQQTTPNIYFIRAIALNFHFEGSLLWCASKRPPIGSPMRKHRVLSVHHSCAAPRRSADKIRHSTVSSRSRLPRVGSFEAKMPIACRSTFHMPPFQN